jgi:putative ABC transport system permease protein
VRLALANLVRQPRRSAVMTVAVGAAVGVAFNIASAASSIHDGVVQSFTEGPANRVWVSNLRPNNSFNIDAKLSPTTLAALARIPGVARVNGTVFLDTEVREPLGVAAADHPNFPFTVVVGPPGPEVLAQGRVLVGTALARRHHLRPGDRLALPTPTGMARVTVGGVWESPNNNGSAVFMAMPMLAALYGPQPVDGVILEAAPGVRPEVLRDRVLGAGLDPALRAYTTPEMGDVLAQDIQVFLQPFWALQRGLLVVAFIAVLSTLLLVGVQRRRELGLLAAVGMPPAGLARLALLEAGIIGVLGTVLGTVAGLGQMVGMMNVTPVFFGLHAPFRLALAAPLLYGAVALAVVLLGAALPAWRTSRLEIVEALQYE